MVASRLNHFGRDASSISLQRASNPIASRQFGDAENFPE